MKLNKIKVGPKIDLMDGIRVGYTRVELRLSLEGTPEATRNLVDKILSGDILSLQMVAQALAPELDPEPIITVSLRAKADGAPTFCQAVERGRTVDIVSMPEMELRVDLG